MKTSFLALVLGLLFVARAGLAQDGLPATYDDGWFLVTNSAVETDVPTNIALIANPPVPSGTAAIAEANTSDISSLARNLQNDPTQIFNWVHDHIRYVHYFGSHKGAEMTLLERSGNDFDQCALLVALLRAAGISASYQFGMVSIPYSASNQQDYQHWVQTAQPNTNWNNVYGLALQINGNAGFPLTERMGGDTNDLFFHHTWVQATIGGTNYNLDPAYKVSLPTNGIGLDSSMQLNTNALIASATNGSTMTADYVQGLNEGGLRGTLGSYNSNLLSYIQSNDPNDTVQQIIGGQSVVSSVRNPLGQATPFTVQTLEGNWPVSTWSYIPTNLMAVLIVTLPGSTNAFYIPGLQGSRLSLVCTTNGMAQLWQEDTQLVSVPTTGGSSPTFDPTLAVQHPFGSWNFTTTNGLVRSAEADQSVSSQPYLRTNATYVLLYGLDANTAWLAKRQHQLDAYREAGYADSSQQVTCETLNVMGLTWLAETELVQELLAGQTATLNHYHHRLGRMGLEAGQGYYIDVYEQLLDTVSNDTTNSSGIYEQNQAFEIGSYFDSALEHGMIEQMQSSGLVAASTVKLLELASTNGQKIFLATSNNWTSGADVSAQITSYSISSLYSSFIGPGYYLLLPTSGLIPIAGTGSWEGSGYVAFQSKPTGSISKMIIGGGYNGGYVSLSSATPVPLTIMTLDDSTTTYYDPQSVTAGFQTKTGGDPVSLLDGSFQVAAGDLSLGGTEPRGLNLTRYYSSARRNSNPAGMSPGWLHSYYCTASPISPWQAELGGTTTPAQMTPIIVAVRAAVNIYNSSQPSPTGWTVTALIAKWAIDQLEDTSVAVNLGNATVEFVRQPDGSYTPPGNCTMSLIKTNGAYWMSERHGRTFKFNTNTLLTNIVDQYGQTMNLTYNASNWVHTVTDWTNRVLTFSYTGPNLTSVTDGTRTVSYGYTSGDLTSFTDAEGKTNSYVYDGNHQVIKTFDALGQLVVSNNYDAYGCVTNQCTIGNTNELWQVFPSGFQTVLIDPAGGQQSYFYDAKSRQTGFQDALGHLTQTFYDGQDHVIETVSPRNETSQFLFDGNNNLIETIDPLGYSNVFLCDGNNNLTAAFDPLGHSNTYTYNSEFDVLTATDGTGISHSMTYNPNGTIATSVEPGGTTTYSYDSYGQLKNIAYPGSLGMDQFLNSAAGDVLTHTNARGFVTTYQYNQRRQLTNTTAPTNLTVNLSYDAVGNLQSTKDARGNTTTSSWSVTRHQTGTAYPATPSGSAVVTNFYDFRDWLNRTLNPLQYPTYYSNNAGQQLIAVGDALFRTNTFVYDPDGHLTNSTDAAMEPTSITNDPRGQAITVTDAAGGIVGKAYDAAGNTIYLTNRDTHVWTFQYDAANRLTNTISPTGKITAQVYTNRGLLASVTVASTNTATFQYDARGRMVTNADNSGVNVYTYDPDNNLGTNSENGQMLISQFDAYDRLTSFTDGHGYGITYSYDNNGNLTKLTYPGNLYVNYYYDALNRLTNVTDWAGRQTTNTYDLAGELTSISRANGTIRTLSYDADGETTNIVEHYVNGAMAIEYIALSYNNAARRQWEFVAPLPQPFTPPSRTLTYDNDNRLATVNGTAVTIDSQGNMTYGPGTNSTFGNYTYDARNRLTGAGGPTYGYDPAGNRTVVTNGSTVTTYVIDPKTSQVLMRIRPGATNYYIYGVGLLYQVDTTATATNAHYYHYDSRGSTVALTDTNGNLTDHIEYSAYGMTTYRVGTNDTPFLYNGEYGVQTDPNGLLFMRARYYNPYICRFLNADPSGFGGGLNMYAFADGNPISETDPFGLGAADPSSGSSWNLGTRLLGGLQVLGGLAEAGIGYTFGTVTAPTVAGGLAGATIGTLGLDQVQAGLRQLLSGQSTPTMLTGVLQGTGMSPTAAGYTSAGLNLVLTGGASASSLANSVPNITVTVTDETVTAEEAASNLLNAPNGALYGQVTQLADGIQSGNAQAVYNQLSTLAQTQAGRQQLLQLHQAVSALIPMARSGAPASALINLQQITGTLARGGR